MTEIHKDSTASKIGFIALFIVGIVFAGYLFSDFVGRYVLGPFLALLVWLSLGSV
jgi:hypothetical protein